MILLLVSCVLYVFKIFTVLSYGMTELTTNDIMNLRWKESWDFIVHKN